MHRYKLVKQKPIIKSVSTHHFNSTTRSNFSCLSQTTNHSSVLSPKREYTGKRCFVLHDLTNENSKKDHNSNNNNNYTNIGLSSNSNSKFMFEENEVPDKHIQKEQDMMNTMTNTNELIKRLKAWDSEHLNNNYNNKPKASKSNLIQHLNYHHHNIDTRGDQFQALTSLNPSSLMLNDLANMKSKKKSLFKFEEKNKLKYNTKNTFNFDVFRSKSAMIAQKEKSIEQKLEINIQELHQPDQYSQYVKDQMKIENINKDNLMKVYQKMIILKMKKRKYQGIINDIYLLLDEARQESFLLADLLSERRRAVDKRYEAFKIEPINPQSELDDYQRKQRENEEALTDAKKLRLHSKRIGKLNSDESNRTPTMSQYINTGKRRDTSKSSNDEETQVLKIKKKTLLEIYEEKRRIRQQYLDIIQDLEDKTKSNQDQFTTIKDQLKKLIEKNKEEVALINTQQEEYKWVYNEMSKNQKKYYLTILKQGIDTRTEGLTWVIKKLIELNASFDNANFPPFLSLDQIEYLIDISKINYEMSQLKIFLSTLKTRQKIILSQQNKSRLEKLNVYTTKKEQEKGKGKTTTLISLDESQDNLETFTQRVNAILLNQETPFKSQLEKKIEDKQIASITKSIKDNATGNIYINDNEDNVVKLMLEYEKKTEYFEDILLLRKRINELESFSKALLKEQGELFKTKYDYAIQTQNSKAVAQYDIIYSALFGQG